MIKDREGVAAPSLNITFIKEVKKVMECERLYAYYHSVPDQHGFPKTEITVLDRESFINEIGIDPLTSNIVYT